MKKFKLFLIKWLRRVADRLELTLILKEMSIEVQATIKSREVITDVKVIDKETVDKIESIVKGYEKH